VEAAKKKMVRLKTYLGEIKNQKRNIADLKENITRNLADNKSQELKGRKRTLKDKNQQEQKLTFEIEYLKNKINELKQQISSKNSQLVADLVKERDVLESKVRCKTKQIRELT
jgi:predicted nuclease with TOPRIM domain